MTDLFTPENENAVLALVLKHPETLDELEHLKPFMFSSKTNQALYKIIKELQEQQLVPDYSMITQFAKSKGQYDFVGGEELLKYLYTLSFPVGNARAYGKLVVDAYKARSLLSLASDIHTVEINSDNIDHVMSDFRMKLDQVNELAAVNTLFSSKDLMKSAWESIGHRIENPGISGVTTGINCLDLATSGMSKNEVWVIAARPSVGKTAVLCNMALNQTLNAGVPVVIFSLEMSRQLLADRLLAINSGVELSNIRLGTLSQAHINKLTDSKKRLTDIPLFITDSSFYDPEDVYPAVRKSIKQTGAKVVYIDYLQLMCERSNEAVHDIGRITRRLKLMSKDLGITFVILSQLNRDVEKRDDKRPQLADLRQSGNIEEDADVVIGLYRDYIYTKNKEKLNELELILLKQRNGPIGTMMSKFFPETNKIEG